MKFLSGAYSKEIQKQLRAAVKGTSWRQAQGVAFQKCGDWFIAGHWRALSANSADGLRIEIMAKPMAIDPMLWAVMRLEDNNSKPLSFRYWGSFICGTPVLEFEIIHEIDPIRAAPSMLAALDRLLPKVLQRLDSEKFSDIARNPAGIHDNWRMSETIAHALRLEGRPDLALQYAATHAGGFSVSRMENGRRVTRKHNELLAEIIENETTRSAMSNVIHVIFRR